ncbi:MAG: hypothetical protein U5L76_01935 [Patescibacteria group bacterium]|nr:hypothetical protein [Patescibacteria group bacterium]
MSVVSRIIRENTYEVSDGTDTLIYAPLKNLIVKKWLKNISEMASKDVRLLLNILIEIFLKKERHLDYILDQVDKLEDLEDKKYLARKVLENNDQLILINERPVESDPEKFGLSKKEFKKLKKEARNK